MKLVKIVIGLLIGYIALVAAFESMIGLLQPEQGHVLTITTTGPDGLASDRVLARLDSGDEIFVSANHWPRAWYREALANPDVAVRLDNVQGAYRAEPVSDAEHDRLQAEHPHTFAFRFITGFPPRYFLRLTPQR